MALVAVGTTAKAWPEAEAVLGSAATNELWANLQPFRESWIGGVTLSTMRKLGRSGSLDYLGTSDAACALI